jgi:hypothetical protein
MKNVVIGEKAIRIKIYGRAAENLLNFNLDLDVSELPLQNFKNLLLKYRLD